MGQRLTPIARWPIRAIGHAGSSRAPTWRISSSSRSTTTPFCIRRRCSRASVEIKHVSPHRNSRLAVILSATALIILWGNAAMAMSLNSPAFQQNGHIPSKYTCDAEDVSPPLAWEGVPNGAKSLVLIIDDPDAPDPKAPKMVWVHWVV